MARISESLRPTGEPLEQKRFIINSESRSQMRRLRDELLRSQRRFPYLSGFGFYGSRTKGRDTTGSDLDVVIFYDSSKSNLNPNSSKYDLRRPDGLETMRFGHAYKPEEQELWEFTKSQMKATKQWINHKFIDISQEQTRKDLDSFRDIDRTARRNPYFNLQLHHNLAMRFILAVGDDVYQNRRMILDYIKSLPDPDSYLQALMEMVSAWERIQGKPLLENEQLLNRFRFHPSNATIQDDDPQYHKYPKTVAEAERYFLTEPRNRIVKDESRLQTLLNKVNRGIATARGKMESIRPG